MATNVLHLRIAFGHRCHQHRFSSLHNNMSLQAIISLVLIIISLANIRLAGALYCLRCFGVPDACSRPSNSQSGAVSVEQCASNQYWCKVSLYSWATQYNVMMGCTETCRPTDPQTLCCQKDMCNCFGSNCYEQLLTSTAPVWFTSGQNYMPMTTWRPQPPPQTPPQQKPSNDLMWPPWWASTTQPTTQKSIFLYEPTPGVPVDRCFECYDCNRNPPSVAYCPPTRANYCVTAVVNFVGLRRVDRFCSDICPPRVAGYISTSCCASSSCNTVGLNSAPPAITTKRSVFYIAIPSAIISHLMTFHR